VDAQTTIGRESDIVASWDACRREERFKINDNAYELATDTFVVQNGKIAAQSFAGKSIPKMLNI